MPFVSKWFGLLHCQLEIIVNLLTELLALLPVLLDITNWLKCF